MTSSFKSRAVQGLVDLHERELRAFHETWKRFAAWRRHLPAITPEELEPDHKTRWGATMSVETLLEHAVVHPMRHPIQLERILDGSDR